MPEQDALKSFQFPKGEGLFTTFSDGDEYKVKVLTIDPVVTNREFETSDGEIVITTKFAFIVYNYTLGKAQILNAGATITREIQRLHQDEEWGANIRNIDIKIKATGEKLNRKYTVTPTPKAETLTEDQIEECRSINLEEKVKDGQRMSFYKPEDFTKPAGGDKVKAQPSEAAKKDVVIEDIGDEPINLDDIPF